MLKCRAWAFVAPELWLLVQPLNSTTKALSSLDFGEGIDTTGAIRSTTWRCASAYSTSDDIVAAVVRMLRGRRFQESFDVAERSAGKGPNAPANALPVRPGS